MKRCKLQRDLDRLAILYGHSTDFLLEAARAEYLIPFCDKHGLKFCPGNGTWAFLLNGKLYAGSQMWSNTSLDKIPKPLLAVLECEIPPTRNHAGSLMREYTSPTYQDA